MTSSSSPYGGTRTPGDGPVVKRSPLATFFERVGSRSATTHSLEETAIALRIASRRQFLLRLHRREPRASDSHADRRRDVLLGAAQEAAELALRQEDRRRPGERLQV